MKIESLKDYINNYELVFNIVNCTYELTSFMNMDYLNYKEWYYFKQVLETIYTDKRNILFVRDKYNRIIGVSSLKKYQNEKKICTLYVLPEYRNIGIGNTLLEESFKWLDTTKPLITFKEYKLNMFKYFINKYNWKLTSVKNDLNNKINELCFNENNI